MSKQTDLINIPDAITVDGAGTAGFGVTPSPWRSLYGDKQVDIGAHSSVYSEAGNTTYLANNFYRNASNAFIYKTTSGASYVSLSQEKVIFAGAASGTAGNSFSFSERARFDSDGLKFNGDTSADNALNDYEEGDWTPTIASYNATDPTVNYNTRTGRYTKIGRIVHLNFIIDISSISGGGQSIMMFTGLPFTMGYENVGTANTSQVSFARTSSGLAPLQKISTGFGFLTAANGGGWSWEYTNIFTSSSAIRGTLSYITDQ